MKTAHQILTVAAALAIGFLAAHWSGAEPARKAPVTDHGMAFEQVVSFHAHLESTGQKETAKRFDDKMNTFLAQQYSAEMGLNVRVMNDIRAGRTNEALRIMEGQLTSKAVGFAASYRALPPALSEKLSLTTLGYARDYCRTHGVKSPHAKIAEIQAAAFQLLEQPSNK